MQRGRYDDEPAIQGLDGRSEQFDRSGRIAGSPEGDWRCAQIGRAGEAFGRHGGRSTRAAPAVLQRRQAPHLLDNAIRHTPEGGEIVVQLRQQKEGVLVEISDTGTGIPNENAHGSVHFLPAANAPAFAFRCRPSRWSAVPGECASPIKTVADLIERSKAEQGKFSLANEGPRTFGGMIARLFDSRAKAGANLVGYSSDRHGGAGPHRGAK